MFTANCNTCGNPKPLSHIGAVDCPDCAKLRGSAEVDYAAANPEASQSDILYAGRAALSQRAHHAHRNFIDPRQFSAGRGMIPIPPANNRGSTQ